MDRGEVVLASRAQGCGNWPDNRLARGTLEIAEKGWLVQVVERQCCGTNRVSPSYVMDAVGLPIVERSSIVEMSAALPHTSADAAARRKSFIADRQDREVVRSAKQRDCP